MKVLSRARLIIFFLVISITLGGCAKKQELGNVELFISKDAERVVYNYFENLKNGKMDSAKRLCTKELGNKVQDIVKGEEEIISFMKERVKEGRDTGYVIVNVVRGVKGKDISNLDKFTATVIRENGDYKISDLQVETIREVYVKNNGVRIIGKDGGNSSLVVRMSDMPKEVYSKKNILKATKEKTPLGTFENLDLGYIGNKIALATKSGDKHYIAVVRIGQLNTSSGGTTLQTTLGDVVTEAELDKPIAQEVVTLDLLTNVSIEKFTFTQNDKFVIVSYVENGAKRIKVYDTDGGNLVQHNFDDVFPSNKYNVEISSMWNDDITIQVSNFKDANNELLGYYRINNEKIGIQKI